MYKKLSKVFVSTISVFSLGLMTIPVCAIENVVDKVSSAENFENLIDKVIVTNEQELIDALKNETVKEIVVEGNITIVKNIDLTNLSRDVKIIVGSPDVLDSSLVVIQGTKINGAGKLTIIKNNDKNKTMIDFRKVMSSGEPSQTIFQGMTISGNSSEIIINNTIDNLLLKNITIQNLTLFANEKTDKQVLQKVNFINSSINSNQNKSPQIIKESVKTSSTSIFFDGIVDSNTSKENLSVVAVDKSGKIIESKNVNIDHAGNVQSVIENLKEGTNYDLYLVKFEGEGENKNAFLSSPLNVSTLNFKSSVESEKATSVQIRISENKLEDKYYPLYLILRLGGVEFKKVQIPRQTTSGDLILNITGLKEDLDYTYEIVSYLDGTNPSIIDKGKFKTLKNSLIIGENNNSSSSVLNFTISQDGIQKSNIEDTSVKVYLNENIQNYAKNGKNFKTNLEGVSVKFVDGKFLVDNLIPGKDYSSLKIYFEIQNGRKVVVSIPKFTTLEETTDLNEFIKDVYFNALNRNPDEVGFWYWVDKLSSKEISVDKFVKNLLNENEFIRIRPTTKSKIEGLYKVIVNRTSDKEGLEFWVSMYESLLKNGYSEEFAVKIVADRMINEDEFKNLVKNLKVITN
ncbi:MAG TPA: DUF4214 domain-containing protein [Candidatus Dwaynia gallinarum]|nr:DUF4214 domain-containing protein [Candidatus Dwaynia gallinarum]